MMLKIKIGKGTNWRVVDNVKSIHYDYIDEKEAAKRRAENAKSQIPIYNVNNYGGPGSEIEVRICEVIVNYNDKSWEAIYTDDTIYVLNNEGKTCDSVGVFK